MSYRFAVMISLGVFLFVAGGLARTYMNFRLNGHLWRGQSSQSTERRYSRLIKEGKAPVLPLVLAVTLMPLGITMAFGTIILHNKHRPPDINVVRPKSPSESAIQREPYTRI